MEHNPTQTLSIAVSELTPGTRIVRLSGPLTIHNFFEFQEVTRQKPLPGKLFVDLTDVPYIDSAALGSFVGIHVSSESSNRKYALIGSNERLLNLYDLTQVGSFLVRYTNMAEAELALA